MPEKENRRTKLTKKLIKDSLMELMETQPIYKITIKDICARADVNRSTFYIYYKDQYDLLVSIENEIIDGVREHLQSYSYNSDQNKILQVLESICLYVVENVSAFKILFSNRQDSDFLSKLVEFSLEQMPSKMDVEKKWDKKTTEYIYLYIISGSLGLIQSWINNGLDKSPKEMSEMIMKLTNQGIKAYDMISP